MDEKGTIYCGTIASNPPRIMDTAVNNNKRRLDSTNNADDHDDKRANTNRKLLPVTLLSGFLG